MIEVDDSSAAADLWNSLVQESGDVRAVARDLAGGRLEPEFHIPGLARFVVLRPLFLNQGLSERIRTAAEAVLGAHRKVLHAVLEDEALKKRHFSGLLEWTEKVLALDRPGPVHATCLRFDGSIAGGEPAFIELNADMPQGAGLCDSFAGFLHGLPVTEEFVKIHPGSPQMLGEPFLEALLSEWRAWGGSGSPRICLATWRDEPVRLKDMCLNRDRFNSRGFETLVADPRDLTHDEGSLTLEGKRIDLVYRVVSTGETIERPEDMRALIEAEKAGSVLMVNSFRSELMGNKSMFALLHDEAFQRLLSRRESEEVSACVPWTALVHDGRCRDLNGEQVDLVEWVQDHREDLVLKPAHDFGGHDVTLGSSCDDAAWEAALRVALENDFIVQKKVKLGTGLYPLALEDTPLRELYEDVDPVLLGDKYAGCVTRLSEDELTNVHLHGAIGAVFELSDAS